MRAAFITNCTAILFFFCFDSLTLAFFAFFFALVSQDEVCDAPRSYHYRSFIKLYNSDDYDETNYTLCRLHIRVFASVRDSGEHPN